ncbi:urate oxidase [Granulicella sp. 5B5]|uniref:factor-independent urate hydroxylase n=1 Tax=Granulicella sp. 5B5 TaxID=1617967 RepID=UPI0015F391DF|nr:urate oxidase [Granulicella sp. 5B5]QMV18183.1 urate oxidase [Granulicella sp. 5B5]
MSTKLATNRYGKSRVRVIRLTKHAGHHDLDEWTVQLLLTGDFETTHTLGDNSKILPTDTMKNTIYVVAHETQATSIEGYAQDLIDYILTRNPQVSSAECILQSHLWKRMTIDGQPYPTAFMHGSNEVQTTRISRKQNAAFEITSGLDGLFVLKTAQSGFTGFIKDSLTTLPETTDRLFGTVVKAEWTYTPAAIASSIDFNKVRTHLREAMLSTFAQHNSLSVQQTLYAMGESALAHTDLIDSVYMLMPNKHNLLIDLARFDRTNPNHIFVPTDEPHGTIEATITRA